VTVLGRHGQGPCVHVPVDDPRVGVLQLVPAPDRWRPDRRGERLTMLGYLANDGQVVVGASRGRGRGGARGGRCGTRRRPIDGTPCPSRCGPRRPTSTARARTAP